MIHKANMLVSKLKGIQPYACSGTFNIQKAESVSSLALICEIGIDS